MAQQIAQVTLTLIINSPLTILTNSLPAGSVGQAYSFQLTAQGGTAPLTWAAVSGMAPGLGLSASGLLSGTPTTGGSFNVVVKVTDSGV